MPQEILSTKTLSWYIKISLISFLLFIETFILGRFFEEFVYKGDYFSLTNNTDIFINIAVTIFFILITFSLSIGGWQKYEEYFYLPLSIGLAIALILINHSFYNGITVSIILTLLIAYNVYDAKSYRKLLVKFEPQMILSGALKGLLFVLTVFGISVLFIGDTSTDITQINVGEKIMQVAKEPLEKTSLFSNLSFDGVQGLIVNQINSFLNPYRSLFKPIMAVFLYLLYMFIGNIALSVCSFLLPPLFKLARAVGIIKITKVIVEQEVPSF